MEWLHQLWYLSYCSLERKKLKLKCMERLTVDLIKSQLSWHPIGEHELIKRVESTINGLL